MRSDHYSISRLRSNFVAFLLGKSCNALLSFTAFVLIVRLLNTNDYAIYVACIAVVELTIALMSFGLDWVAIRYIPEFRLHASQLQFRKFLLRLLGVQFFVILAGSTLTNVLSEKIAVFLNIGDLSSFLLIYSLYLAVEGLGRIVRDQFLGQLLLQGTAQLALLSRNAALVVGLLVISNAAGQTTIQDVAISEVIAAAIGTLIAATGLLRVLFAQEEGNSLATNWSPPSFWILWRLARASYASYLCSLTYGPQVVVFLLSRFAGAEATAAFGFARNLTEQIKRYLPIELFLGLIRPTLIAQYVTTKDIAALNRNTGAIVLVSLVVLSPIVVLAFTSSAVVTTVLSNRHQPQADFFMVLMVCALVPFSLRRFVETIANTVGHPEACTWANAALIVFPLLTWLSLSAGLAPYTASFLSLLAECFFSYLALAVLRKSGYSISFPWKNFFLISCAVGVACAPLALFQLIARYEWMSINGLVILFSASLVCSGLSMVLFKPIDRSIFDSIASFVRGRKS